MKNREAQIEQQFIAKLVGLKYRYRPDIRNQQALEDNFRKKFEQLNGVQLSDREFKRLLDEIVTRDVFEASQKLRTIQSFIREDNSPLNYTLVDLKDWCRNDFEVVNQLRINTKNTFHRYDVILLVNGLPLVQIELKDLIVSTRKAMEQIVDYKNDKENGYLNTLLCFMQLFIVSNQNNTYYFANNREEHFNFNADERFLPVYQFANPDNTKITDLDEFSEKFLGKCLLSQMISRYMVLVMSEKKIMVMRPYQIYAVKAIVDSIHQNRGNGYVWHTTGSGKTLTSFKTATLLKDNPDIDKCLFVVDRKDLDRQTREEFNKFQENCVEENTNTEQLVKRLLSDNYADKVIVTTIQKLGLALDENSQRNQEKKKDGYRTFTERLAPVREKRMAIIFDECHRSQFGDNHKAIKAFFPKSQLFGFTGTPIFEQNATAKRYEGEEGRMKTTEDIFQHLLHTYTITHAIDDKNVLKFHVDYYKPDGVNTIPFGQVAVKKAVVETIIAKHDAVTNNRMFNAIFATGSINDAIEYYQLFKEQQAAMQAKDESFRPLQVACVFSPPAEGNKDVKQIQQDLEQEKLDNEQNPEEKKAALTQIMEDYNAQYKTNHRIAEFDMYYQDVQSRIKKQQYSNKDWPRREKIDIIIVVDMLLTGFDSKYLNTLYVDKNLKYHGLIQAFSRTNRVLNDNKPKGNILDFRGQKEAMDEAIALFSGKVGEGEAQKIWLVEPLPTMIEKYKNKVVALQAFMAKNGLECKPDKVTQLRGDIARAEFLTHFKEIQKLNSNINQYTELNEAQKKELQSILPETQLRGFKGMYLETAQVLREKQQSKESGELPEQVQQLDFEFVLFASAVIDYDYIMGLAAKLTQVSKGKQVTMTHDQLISLLESSANVMEERAEMIAYVRSLKMGQGLSEKEVKEGYQQFKMAKAAEQLSHIAAEYGLAPEALEGFVDEILMRKIFDGEVLTDLFAPQGLGWKQRKTKEEGLMSKLLPILHKRVGKDKISGLAAYEQG